MAYLCPLCHAPLSRQDRVYQCPQNHQFDIAKEGYVNLMPAHHKRSRDPGDNKEMMQARRRFLDQAHYHPMRAQVAELCRQFIIDSDKVHIDDKKDEVNVLDIGCGEGYYTTHIADALCQAQPQTHVYGLDISKVAIRYAAKRYPNCDFSVASSYRLPFADHSLDGIVRIYAPCKAEELSRVLTEKGIVIIVTPAARHLYQLRENIYQEVRLHQESAEELSGFEVIHQQHLNYMMELTGSDAFDLLQMTPFAWKASDELRQNLLNSKLFQCEADFMLTVYRKTDPNSVNEAPSNRVVRPINESDTE